MPQLTSTVFCGILLCMRMIKRDPLQRFLIKVDIGDIVKQRSNGYHYLVLQALEEDGEEYYGTICLEDGVYCYLGLWDYLIQGDYEVVA